MPTNCGYQLLLRLQELLDPVPLVLMTGFGYDPGHSIVKARQAGIGEPCSSARRGLAGNRRPDEGDPDPDGRAHHPAADAAGDGQHPEAAPGDACPAGGVALDPRIGEHPSPPPTERPIASALSGAISVCRAALSCS